MVRFPAFLVLVLATAGMGDSIPLAELEDHLMASRLELDRMRRRIPALLSQPDRLAAWLRSSALPEEAELRSELSLWRMNVANMQFSANQPSLAEASDILGGAFPTSLVAARRGTWAKWYAAQVVLEMAHHGPTQALIGALEEVAIGRFSSPWAWPILRVLKQDVPTIEQMDDAVVLPKRTWLVTSGRKIYRWVPGLLFREVVLPGVDVSPSMEAGVTRVLNLTPLVVALERSFRDPSGTRVREVYAVLLEPDGKREEILGTLRVPIEVETGSLSLKDAGTTWLLTMTVRRGGGQPSTREVVLNRESPRGWIGSLGHAPAGLRTQTQDSK